MSKTKSMTKSDIVEHLSKKVKSSRADLIAKFPSGAKWIVKVDREKQPDNKPVVYKIITDSGKNNYTGVAKKGRVQDKFKSFKTAKGGKAVYAKVSQNGKINYKLLNHSNIERNDSLGEFLNRPLFILKSKKLN
jgi:hypothetical protein